MLNQSTETWKDVIDFEGHYQVSNLGRLRSIRTSQGTYRERLKKTFISNQGYEQVNLFKNNKSYTTYSTMIHNKLIKNN